MLKKKSKKVAKKLTDEGEDSMFMFGLSEALDDVHVKPHKDNERRKHNAGACAMSSHSSSQPGPSTSALQFVKVVPEKTKPKPNRKKVKVNPDAPDWVGVKQHYSGVLNEFMKLAAKDVEIDEAECQIMEALVKGWEKRMSKFEKRNTGGVTEEKRDGMGLDPKCRETFDQKMSRLKEMEETVVGIAEIMHFIRVREEEIKMEGPRPAEFERKTFSGRMRIVSWELGLSKLDYLGQRAKAAADLIRREKFDVIMLQEVNPFIARYFTCRLLKLYHFIPGQKLENATKGCTYTLIRKTVAYVYASKIIYFPKTGQHRSLLRTEIKIGSTKLYILNTHLEGLNENSECRIQQLAKCFSVAQSLPREACVIFGGNLNLRDWELKDVNQEHLTDLWTMLGNSENEFSWDLRINKLVQIIDKTVRSIPIKEQPFKRFSRIYIRPDLANCVNPRSFDLIGKEIVAGGNYCVSDHFAIQVEFDIKH